MGLIPLKHWLMIGAIAALVVAGNVALTKAYNDGVEFQKTLQSRADLLFTDLRNAEKERIESEAQKRVAGANADRDRAVTANTGLQRQLAEIKRIAQEHSGTIGAGGSARDAVVLLAQLLGECSDRYNQMAGFADAAHNAGRTCQAQYNSLRGGLK